MEIVKCRLEICFFSLNQNQIQTISAKYQHIHVIQLSLIRFQFDLETQS